VNAAILIALAACALSCYFAACQIALKTFSRKRLAEFLAQRGREHQLEPFVEHLPQLLLLTGTLRTSFNLIVLLAVLYFVQTRFDFSDWGWLSGYEWLAYYLISFLITGALVSVFGVAIAVSLARYSREPLLGRSIPLFNIMLVVLKPLASFLHLFDPLVRRLSGADLTRASLVAASLVGVDLTGADLTFADLTGADLADADVEGAEFTDALLKDVNEPPTE